MARSRRYSIPLERKPGAELELAWVGGGGGAAGVGVEEVYVESVVLVDEVEGVGGDLEGDLVGQGEGAGEAEVGEDDVGLHPGIAAQVAVEGGIVHRGVGGGVDVTGQVEGSGGGVS